MATKPSTELDFDAIKNDLIEYIKSNTTFTDYNFEGSALNTIIDLLAYNTHTNAVIASMAHAENFIDSAQKRASVVSRAKEMGYVPRSAVCSTSYVDITANGLLTTAILTRGTPFTSSNENGNYIFCIADTVTSSSVVGGQKFSNVKLVAGVQVTNTFTVDTTANIRTILNIPNKNVDISTLKVYYRESVNSLTRTELTYAEDVYGVTGTSKVFFIQESYDGYFQIYFGSNAIGFQPPNNSVIEIDYFICSDYSAPDGSTLFNINGTIGDATSVNIVTKQVATGGSDKEDINSIKLNAKRSNTAKERAVVATDFELAVRENFNFVKSVSVWGGEDNIPPIYGKVFIAVQPVAGYTISDTVKRDVMIPAIKKNANMTVTPVIVDPEYLLIDITTNIKFNPSKSAVTTEILNALVKSEVTTYIDSISTFNGDYIESSLLSKVTDKDPGVISAAIDKRVAFRIAPLVGVQTSYTRSVNNKIKQGSIKSTKFKVATNSTPISVIIKETATTSIVVDGLGNFQTVVDIGLYNDLGELLKTIGTVNLATGKFEFALRVESYLSANRFVHISFELDRVDISSSLNQILVLDSTTFEDSTIGLVANNVVRTEFYTK